MQAITLPPFEQVGVPGLQILEHRVNRPARVAMQSDNVGSSDGTRLAPCRSIFSDSDDSSIYCPARELRGARRDVLEVAF